MENIKPLQDYVKILQEISQKYHEWQRKAVAVRASAEQRQLASMMMRLSQRAFYNWVEEAVAVYGFNNDTIISMVAELDRN